MLIEMQIAEYVNCLSYRIGLIASLCQKQHQSKTMHTFENHCQNRLAVHLDFVLNVEHFDLEPTAFQVERTISYVNMSSIKPVFFLDY